MKVCDNCGARIECVIDGWRGLLITSILVVVFALCFLALFEYARARFYPELPILPPSTKGVTYG